MLRHTRTTLAACAVGIPVAVVLAGCGGGLSADAVAKIDGKEITKAQYDKSFKYATYKANTAQVLAGKNPKMIVPDAPNFTNCIKQLKAQTPKPPKGQPAPTDAQFKANCKNGYDQIKQMAIFDPLLSEVLRKEAEENDVKISQAELDKGWANYLAQPTAIGGKQNLAKFTKLTGLGEDVLRQDQRNQLILQKLQTKITKENGKVTDKDVQDYYNKNKAQFTQPETRGLHVVLTKTEAKAKAAKAELEKGAAFAKVAKKYSVDQVTRNAGGKLSGVAKGQQERGLENAAFGAKKDELVGPVKTESGWYVVRVDNITPAKTTPFDKVKDMLKQQVTAQKQQTAFTDWQKKVIKDWQKKTECRKGYDAQFCKGYKEPKPQTPAGGGAGGAGAPQQAPPTGG
ncbi:peptidyl-prolyl cis-trans isomerase [Patulibacter defluvii]|uniref:peptidyl-prolyl cis-trans isomerase n=1 Tax=Patulibacter defluvii TaxID=3095358 RepID=UPI002A763CD7|nr:peptidyl-prolyl cis-trans isomerase [Patulibacter sp. DM4]